MQSRPRTASGVGAALPAQPAAAAAGATAPGGSRGFAFSDEDGGAAAEDEEGGPSDGEGDERGALAPQAAEQHAAAASSPPEQQQPPDSGYAPVVFWVVVSAIVILFNKALYASVFPHPLTLTAIHMAAAAAITGGMRAVGWLQPPALGWAAWGATVLPIGVLYSVSLGASNLAAARLSVSFMQMIKALMPLATLAAAVAFRMESPSWRQALIVSTLVVGVAVAAHGELLWEPDGVALQLLSVAAEAVRLVLVQRLLQAQLPKGTSPLVSIALFAPPAAALLGAVAAALEPGALGALARDPAAAALVALNTAAAFTLNIAVVLLVRATSSLTLTLAGVVKDVLLIVLSIVLFHSPVTATQIGGYGIALTGLNIHDAFKSHGKDAGLRQVVVDALTNRRMLLISICCCVLFGISQTRLHLDHWV